MGKQHIYSGAVWLDDGDICPIHPIDKWVYTVAYKDGKRKYKLILEEINEDDNGTD